MEVDLDLDLDLVHGLEQPTCSSLNQPLPSIVVTPPSPVRSMHRSNIASEVNQENATEYPCYPQTSEACNDLDIGLKLNEENSLSKTPDGDSDPVLPQERLLNVSVDTTINVPRPCHNVSERSLCSVEDSVTAPCRYSSTPKTKGDGCFDNSLPSIDTTSPILQDASNDGSPCFMNISEPKEACSETGTVDPMAMPELLSGDHTFSNYLNQSYNRAVPLARESQLRAVSGRLNFDLEGIEHCLEDGATGSQQLYSSNGCYFPVSDNSWMDLTHSSDVFPSTQVPFTSLPESGEYFVYPSIYVSSAGLISVLLKNDMSVEMTVDRTIRVVSHNHMMAVATDSRGTSACLNHPAVKVFQTGTTTDIATDNFRARMGAGDNIVFSNGATYFRLEDWELQPTAPLKFTDILRDQSVNLLFSSEGYGESLVASCMQVAAQAEYANLPKGGVIVRINGVKVTQTGSGDVTVVSGAKFIRLSPHVGTTRLGNRFVNLEVEKDWSVKLTRGSHSFYRSRKCSMVSNGKMEAGYDENNVLKVLQLQARHPILADPALLRRPIRKTSRILVPSYYATKRRPGPGAIGGREM